MVLRPGPVQGPGSGFWPGHRVIESVLFKKSQRVCNRVLSGQPGRRVTLGFSFPCFFFNPARVQPQVPGRPAMPDRVSKLWLSTLAVDSVDDAYLINVVDSNIVPLCRSSIIIVNVPLINLTPL